MRLKSLHVAVALLLFTSCEIILIEIPQWSTYEIILNAEIDYSNPYLDVDVIAEFSDSKGRTYLRPVFWDGDDRWKIRFAPPHAGELYNWSTVVDNDKDPGLSQSGSFRSIEADSSNYYSKSGLLKMSPRHRNVMHQDGSPFLVVGDTPWALPFRATHDQVLEYAQDRQRKGFNTALLMTIQPDQRAQGPDARNTTEGFARAFDDVPTGHATILRPDYFQYLDTSLSILREYEIVPVLQPIFHGFGWKGLGTLGKDIPAEEYVRYCRYLLARYGSYPAIWLLAGDNNAQDPGVKEAGEMMEVLDCYQQPTGLHYNPCDDFIAKWASNHPDMCMHYNKVHQEEDWLDFQWAQTGHDGLHLYHKVERMYDNLPTKAVANGEPTYEGMNNGKNGLGWWQGEEAWMQLMSGGTMGVVYGAATLWQWKVDVDEPGWEPWTDQRTSWREAMRMEGSNFVGMVGRILSDYNLAEIEKRWDLADGLPLLAREGELYISYLNEGGNITISSLPENRKATWINPKNGKTQVATDANGTYQAPSSDTWVLIIEKE